MRMFKAGLALAMPLALAAWSNADTVTYCDAVDVQRTNWSEFVTLPKFDPALGTLISIKLALHGHVEGSAAFESLDNEASTVNMSLKADITLYRPDLSELIVVLPSANTSDNVGPFDGAIDFGGTSGRTYGNLSADQSDSVTSPPPASDLALFTGPGNILLPVIAEGTSTGSGAGNLILQFQTFAGADVCVTYNYRPAVIPEPTTVSLGGLGLSALAMMLRRRA